MEYQTDNNELEAMRQQLRTLKNKLESQKIVTDRLILRAMRKKMSWIARYAWFQLLVMYPFIFFGFFNMAYRLQISWGVFYFTIITIGIMAVADIFINRTTDKDWMNETLAQTCHKLAQMKRLRRYQLIAGIPVAVTIVAWMIHDILHSPMLQESSRPMAIGMVTGGFVGGFVGLRIFRKMQHTNDDIIRQIKDIDTDINE